MQLLSKITAIQKVASWIVARSEEVIGAIFLLAITSLIFAQVIYREIALPMAWMEETARYIFVAFAFIMMALTTRRREHLVVEVLPLIIRKKLTVDIINLGIQLICLILFGIFTYLSYDYMVYSWGTPGYAPASGFHLGWPKSALFVGGALATGHYLAIVIKDAAKLKRKASTNKEVTWRE